MSSEKPIPMTVAEIMQSLSLKVDAPEEGSLHFEDLPQDLRASASSARWTSLRSPIKKRERWILASTRS
jgi:hypothetical protein